MVTKMMILLAMLLGLAQFSEELCLEDRVQQLEDLLAKVARPYLSLPNNTAGAEYYMHSFNYRDQMALSACTGLAPAGRYIYQVRRDCGKTGIPSSQTCTNICRRVTAPTGSVSTCFDALHLYYAGGTRELNPSYGPFPNDGKRNLWSYHYGGSGCNFQANHCGPNYCCCMAS